MKYYNFNSYIMTLVAIILIILIYLSSGQFHGILFNSDAVYLPAVFSDIFTRGGKLSDWYLTPAPYFFPDYLIFSAAYATTSEAYEQILYFAILQCILFTFLITSLATHVSFKHRLTISSLATIILLYLSTQNLSTYAFVLVSAHHYGAFLSTLAFCSLWIYFINSDNTPRRAAAMTVLCGLAFATTLSDNIFAIQTLIPFLSTCAFFALIRRENAIKNAAWAILPVGFGAAGSLSYPLVVSHQTRFPIVVDFADTANNIKSVLNMLYNNIFSSYANGILMILFAFTAATTLKYYFRQKSISQSLQNLAWMYIFTAISAASVLGASALSSNLAITERYYIPIYVWPILLCLISLAYYLGHRFALIATSTSFIIILLLGGITYKAVTKSGIHKEYYPEEIACIDKALERTGSRNGIAGYWDAKYIQTFSRISINIAQYTSNLRQFKWITSERNFKDRYDFALSSSVGPPTLQIPIETLTSINGQPSEVINCGTRTVFIYSNEQLRTK